MSVEWGGRGETQISQTRYSTAKRGMMTTSRSRSGGSQMMLVSSSASMMTFSDELTRDWRSEATDDLGLVAGKTPPPPLLAQPTVITPSQVDAAPATAALPFCLTTVDAVMTAVTEADDTKSQAPPPSPPPP